MNNKLLKYCLIFIAGCLAASILLFRKTDLKEPVFLEHYYEILSDIDQYIELFYITNFYDDAALIGVSFPQADDANVFVYASEIIPYWSDTYSRYKLQTIRFKIGFDSPGLTDEIVLENVEILLSNGKSVTGNIGKIILLQDDRSNIVKLIETTMSSTSSTGGSGFDARFLDDVSITDMPFVLKAETEGILKIFVNNLYENDTPDFSQNKLEIAKGVRFGMSELMAFTSDSLVLEESGLPYTFHKDEHVLMASEFKIDSDDTRKYNRYNIHRRIYLENPQGETGLVVMYNINYYPYLNGNEIKEILKHKGVK